MRKFDEQRTQKTLGARPSPVFAVQAGAPARNRLERAASPWRRGDLPSRHERRGAGEAVNPYYGIFGWLVIGAMTGAIGGRIPDGEDGGLPSVVTGVVGAAAGGFAASPAFGPAGETADLLGSLTAAFLGACLFVLVGRAFSRLSRRTAEARRQKARQQLTRSWT
jgi:uncharacterized membrane protein YeaQ/YmgE (transglycosylase-associated protein family)